MLVKSYEKINGTSALTVKGLGSYSLCDTMECGQCFRYERVQSSLLSEYFTVVEQNLIHVGQREIGELIFFDMEDDLFEHCARTYFSLDLPLNEIKNDILSRTNSEWLKAAAMTAEGIAILKQSPWEALLSFIISQNNNIPRIRKIIREISAAYGVNISLQNGCKKCPMELTDATPCEEICKKCGRCYTFPSADAILKEPEKLLLSKPGFRYKYMLDAAERTLSKEISLDEIDAAHSYEYTLAELKKIKGVGDKVASCVALFGFGNLEAFPVDVWMKRAIDEYFDGKLDPTSLGKYAGIAQQYIFHYIRNIENS